MFLKGHHHNFIVICILHYPINLMKEKLLDLIERTFKREEPHYLDCNDTDHRRNKLRSCQNVCDALSHLLDSIYIRFGTGCFIICVTIKNCYGFFEYAKIYQRLTQPCSRHSQVLFYVTYDKL